MTHSDSCILTIDAGGTSLKAALFPEHAENAASEITLMKQTFFSLDVASDGNRDEILAVYRAIGRRAAALAKSADLSLSRIAVCTPGPFNYAKGCSLMTHKYQAICGIPLAPQLCEGAGADYPVTFLHDSTAFLLGASLWMPAADGQICGVTIGTGLGFACMKDGKILQTPSGGPAVSIYARPYLDGISEDYVSKRGILKQYQKEAGLDHSPKLTVADIAALARDGVPAAQKTFADTGFHLGRILLPILTEYRFDTVVLGGAISKSADLFLPQLTSVIAGIGTAVYPATDIDLSPLAGAARYQSTFIQTKSIFTPIRSNVPERKPI